jgi:hypothetical protein
MPLIQRCRQLALIDEGSKDKTWAHTDSKHASRHVNG